MSINNPAEHSVQQIEQVEEDWQLARPLYTTIYDVPGTYSWSKPEDINNIRLLLVAAGAGGGAAYEAAYRYGGGGGAGGVIYKEAYDVTGKTNISIVVGEKGTGSTVVNSKGGDGGNSSFGTLEALGGGGGGSTSNEDGENGGSGGGGASRVTSYLGSGGTGTLDQGHDGADGDADGSGGGGGAENAASKTSGGSGVTYDISGEDVTYGIGGDGRSGSGGAHGTNALEKTGSGGEGARGANDGITRHGGDGSDGVVVIGKSGYYVSGNRVLKTELSGELYTHVHWTATEPTNTSFKVFAALTGTDTEPAEEEYVEATNGEALPVITDGEDYTGQYLWIKQSFETNNDEETAVLESFETIIFNSPIKWVHVHDTEYIAPDEWFFVELIHADGLSLNIEMMDYILKEVIVSDTPYSTPDEWAFIELIHADNLSFNIEMTDYINKEIVISDVFYSVRDEWAFIELIDPEPLSLSVRLDRIGPISQYWQQDMAWAQGMAWHSYTPDAEDFEEIPFKRAEASVSFSATGVSFEITQRHVKEAASGVYFSATSEIDYIKAKAQTDVFFDSYKEAKTLDVDVKRAFDFSINLGITSLQTVFEVITASADVYFSPVIISHLEDIANVYASLCNIAFSASSVPSIEASVFSDSSVFFSTQLIDKHNKVLIDFPFSFDLGITSFVNAEIHKEKDVVFSIAYEVEQGFFNKITKHVDVDLSITSVSSSLETITITDLSMADYLPTATAEYTAQEFELFSQGSISEKRSLLQDVYEMHSHRKETITYEENVIYEVSVSHDTLLPEESTIIIDLICDPNKAFGSYRSFYWHHPIDGHVYVARFKPSMQKNITNVHSIPNVEMWIEGVRE